jgi:tape measure domain-containing protein
MAEQVKIAITAQDRTQTALQSVQRSLGKLERSSENLSRSLGTVGTAFQAVVGAVGVRALVNYADSYTSLSNKLKNAVGDTQDFTRVQQDVYRIAQLTGSGLSETADLYAKIARNSKQLGLETAEVSKLTETFAKTLKISGATTTEAAAATLQFGQALASGRLQGDELRSLLENNNRFSEALATSLGVTTGKLRSLGTAGVLSAELVSKALLQQSSVIDKEFAGATDTVAQGMTRVSNAFILLVGNLEKETGIFRTLAGGLTFVAQNLDTLIGVAGTAAAAAAPLLIARIAIALKALGLVIARNPLVVTAAALSSLIAGLTVFKGNLEGLGGLIKEFFGFGPDVSEGTEELENFGSTLNSTLTNGIDLSSKQSKELKNQNALLLYQKKTYTDLIDLGGEFNMSVSDISSTFLKPVEKNLLMVQEAMKIGVSLTEEQIRKTVILNDGFRSGKELVDRMVAAGVKLTDEQKEQLALTIDNQVLQEDIEKILREQTEEVERQKNEQRRLGETVLAGIRAAGPQASRFIDLIGAKIVEVGDQMKLVFETTPQVFFAKLVLSSKRVSSAIEESFAVVGSVIDGIFGGVNETVEDTGITLEEIERVIKQLETANEDLFAVVNNLSDQEREFLQIERDREEALNEANTIQRTYAVYLANSNAELQKTAYFISVMRTATDAFTASAQTFLDAVTTEGFTNLQKQVFQQLNNFSDTVLTNYDEAVAAAGETIASLTEQIEFREAIISAKGAAGEAAAAVIAAEPDKQKKMVEFAFGQLFLTEFGRKVFQAQAIEFGKSTELMSQLTSEQVAVVNKLISGQMLTSQEVITFGNLQQDLGKIIEKISGELPDLESSLGEASTLLEDNNATLETATKGLKLIIQDIFRTEYEAGASLNTLKAEAKILEDQFAAAGLSLKDLLTFIDSLPSVTVGAQAAMGGLVSGALHSNGGVRSFAPGGPIELEGGEYIMRRDAVQRYGQAFMDAVNKGQWTYGGGGSQVEVSIYDGTGQRISEYDSALRVEIKERAARNSQFAAVA